MSPTPLAELGRSLKELRVRAGLTGEQMAAALRAGGVPGHQAKVSRIEAGKQLPTDADVRAWAGATGADDPAVLLGLLDQLADARVWRETFPAELRGVGQSGLQRSYTEHVQNSVLVRHFETVWVPGLAQTEAYMRQVFTESAGLHGVPVDDMDAAVAARLARQELLYSGKEFEFLMWEPVLRTPVPGYTEMRAQLDRLSLLSYRPNVRLGIIPLGVPLATTPQNSVQVYVEEDGPHAVTETFAGEHWCDLGETAAYQNAIDRLWADAREGGEARELIEAAMRDLGASDGA